MPALGAGVLDLACGTGFVTILAAQTIGSSGTVIGVDITPGTLREVREKALDGGCAKMGWIEHDVTLLNEVEAVQSVARQKGVTMSFHAARLLFYSWIQRRRS